MGCYVAERVIDLMDNKKIKVEHSNVLIMGFTFKENCPDLRNTRVIDLVYEFENRGCNVDVYDPHANKDTAKLEYDIQPIEQPEKGKYDAILLAVAHDEFKQLSIEKIKSFGNKKFVIYDIKYLLNLDEVDGRL